MAFQKDAEAQDASAGDDDESLVASSATRRPSRGVPLVASLVIYDSRIPERQRASSFSTGRQALLPQTPNGSTLAAPLSLATRYSYGHALEVRPSLGPASVGPALGRYQEC